MNNEITKIERDDLKNCESTLESAESILMASAIALTRIRDGKLYRQDYSTFEEYLKGRWGWSRSYAHRLIEAASIKMLPIGNKIQNEGQARAILSVPEKHRELVIERASEAGPITAKSISKAAEQIQDAVQLDKEGWPIPKDIQEDWNKAQEVNRLLAKVSEVKCALQEAKDSDNILFVEVLQSTIGDLKNAYTGLKQAIPYAVCTCEGHGRKKCTLCRGRGFLSQFRYEQCVPMEIKAIRKKSRAKVAA